MKTIYFNWIKQKLAFWIAFSEKDDLLYASS